MTDETTRIWELYRKGVDHHNAVGMYRETEKCHNFYIGDQWKGLQSGDEEFPVFNFIKPVGKYKISMIAQNQMSIVYSAMGGDRSIVVPLCELLSAFAAAQWEKNKMDTLSWHIIKNAFITGDGYLYCYDAREPSDSVAPDRKPKLNMQLVGKTNLYLADEQNPALNEQEWIIISERISVAAARERAKKNGLQKEQLDLIVSDEETETRIGADKTKEVKTELGKCTSLLFLKKTDKGISYCRSVKNVIYEPEQTVTGLDVYPLAGMRWEERPEDARGVSGVKYMIPNQLEVNKTAARRALAVKRFSFPTLVYDATKIVDVDAISKIGANIALQGNNAADIDRMIRYLNPAPISADAERLQQQLTDSTRELEGAGDAATGQVDPTQASGEAIRAARDQAAVPLNEQIASFKQFVEDIALLWYKLWVAYSPGGLQISYQKDGQSIDTTIPAEILEELDIDIKIDVSPVDPYSKLSREVALERLLAGQNISFEEYVNALDDSSSVPKATLLSVIENRNTQIPPELLDALRSDPALSQQIMAAAAGQRNGGMQDAMPQL